MYMKVDIDLPETINDITIESYQKFLRVVRNNEEKDELFIQQKMVQYFCGTPLNVVDKIRRQDFIMIIDHLKEVLKCCENAEFVDRFEHDGKMLGFIPNLEKITMGEYADIDSLLGDDDKLHTLIGVLYRPIKAKMKNKYVIEPYDSNNIIDMSNAPLGIAMGALVFFYNLSNELLSATPRHLKRIVMTDKRAKAALEQSGDGTASFLNSLETICSDLKRYLQLTFKPVSFTGST